MIKNRCEEYLKELESIARSSLELQDKEQAEDMADVKKTEYLQDEIKKIKSNFKNVEDNLNVELERISKRIKGNIERNNKALAANTLEIKNSINSDEKQALSITHKKLSQKKAKLSLEKRYQNIYKKEVQVIIKLYYEFFNERHKEIIDSSINNDSPDKPAVTGKAIKPLLSFQEINRYADPHDWLTTILHIKTDEGDFVCYLQEHSKLTSRTKFACRIKGIVFFSEKYRDALGEYPSYDKDGVSDHILEYIEDEKNKSALVAQFIDDVEAIRAELLCMFKNTVSEKTGALTLPPPIIIESIETKYAEIIKALCKSKKFNRISLYPVNARGIADTIYCGGIYDKESQSYEVVELMCFLYNILQLHTKPTDTLEMLPIASIRDNEEAISKINSRSQVNRPAPASTTSQMTLVSRVLESVNVEIVKSKIAFLKEQFQQLDQNQISKNINDLKKKLFKVK